MLSVQFSSVAQSCLTLCNPMNHSTPGLPVPHQLPEFTQTHVHRVGDAIQPSHPLSSPSPPAPNPSQHQSFPMSQLFAWGGQTTGVSAGIRKSQKFGTGKRYHWYGVWKISKVFDDIPFANIAACMSQAYHDVLSMYGQRVSKRRTGKQSVARKQHYPLWWPEGASTQTA